MKWGADAVVAAITSMLDDGDDLAYAASMRRDASLVRGAIRRFGSWRSALRAAGLDPDLVYARRRWDTAAVLGRIRDLYSAGVDLSLASMARVDPRVVAAACQDSALGSWQSAVEAAGIRYSTVSRRRRWTRETVVAAIRELRRRGVDLNAGNVQLVDRGLLTGGRRVFGTWPAALSESGLPADSIVMRRRVSPKQRVCEE